MGGFPRDYVGGEAEVGDFDVAPVVGLREEDVLGLEIAVDDALLVAVAQRVEQRADNDLRLALGVRLAAQNRVEQLAALRDLLDYVEVLRVLQKVLQADHVRVRAQLVHDATLALESTPAGITHFQRGHVAIAEVGLADDLDRHQLAGGGEHGLADDSVLAVAQHVAQREHIGDDAVGGLQLGEADGVHVGHRVVEAVDEAGDVTQHVVVEVARLDPLELFEERGGARVDGLAWKEKPTRLSASQAARWGADFDTSRSP